MVQSPSWEANWFAASQEIPCISRNPKVHYRTNKRPPTVSILGQPNPVHITTSHLPKIHPNIIHPSTPRSPQWSPSLRFPHRDPIHPLSSLIRATCPTHLILLYFIPRTILGEEYKSFSSQYKSFSSQYSTFSSQYKSFSSQYKSSHLTATLKPPLKLSVQPTEGKWRENWRGGETERGGWPPPSWRQRCGWRPSWMGYTYAIQFKSALLVIVTKGWQIYKLRTSCLNNQWTLKPSFVISIALFYSNLRNMEDIMYIGPCIIVMDEE